MRLLLLCFVLFASFSAKAQNLFWSFNDEQQPLTIAPECDARFEEVQGGVFMPTTEEVYQHGLMFLEDPSDEIRRQAPYCFLAAAFDGNADAQFQLAQLYNKGDILPQDDLSAYKWAFIAALNGNKEAENYTLTLEQFLTTQDLEATSPAIEAARLQIQENMQRRMEALQQEFAEDGQLDGELAPGQVPLPTPMDEIFDDEDHVE